MDKDMASRMLRATRTLEVTIGELDVLTSQLTDMKEKEEFVRALGDVIGIVSDAFVRRIARQYPELDPDR